MTGATITSPAGTSGTASQEAESTTHDDRVAELKTAMPKWLDAAAGYKPQPVRNPSLPTLVGLLILVMCFFVVLTSISLKDANREQSVMASLSRAFSETGLAPTAPIEAEADARKLLGDLRATLNPEVPLVTGVKPETADDYELKLPKKLVFAEDGKIAAGFDGILAQAMKALKTGPADFAYEIEVDVSAPQLGNDAIQRAAAVAAELRKAGFANDASAVSLQQGSGDAVSLTIRLRPNARLDGQP